jgi:hypothetical protein
VPLECSGEVPIDPILRRKQNADWPSLPPAVTVRTAARRLRSVAEARACEQTGRMTLVSGNSPACSSAVTSRNARPEVTANLQRRPRAEPEPGRRVPVQMWQG